MRVSVGDVVDLAPHCDLWMRGAKKAEIRRIYTQGDVVLRVRPIVGDVPQRKLFSVLPHHVLGGL